MTNMGYAEASKVLARLIGEDGVELSSALDTLVSEGISHSRVAAVKVVRFALNEAKTVEVRDGRLMRA
jgi:hypothetical protein